MLAKNLNLRNTPELSFVLDESIEYGVNMSKLIDTVREKGKKEKKMHNLADYLKEIKTVAIAGHVNPDGDCIGSCGSLAVSAGQFTGCQG